MVLNFLMWFILIFLAIHLNNFVLYKILCSYINGKGNGYFDLDLGEMFVLAGGCVNCLWLILFSLKFDCTFVRMMGSVGLRGMGIAKMGFMIGIAHRVPPCCYHIKIFPFHWLKCAWLRWTLLLCDLVVSFRGF
jgi:hypothetical protein